MKNIAIFCDGSWQNFTQRDPTNVARLARATLAQGAVPQLIYYDDGVGVAQGAADHLVHILGGAFGKGLDYKIARAYEFLCLNYVPGDRIFLFGFSRGAYTVRSLAGLLRQVWILRREEAARVDEAVDLYRSRPAADADAQRAAAWDADVKHFYSLWCYPVGDVFTDGKAYDPADPGSLDPPDRERCAWVQYVGVWDTVGSLGIPSGLPFADTVDKQYAFHDLSLSRFVRSARHAVSLDEKRATFVPSLWTNVAELNTNASAAALPYARRPYQQAWFPGGHGSVGGGGASPISYPPLLWIAEGAARAGLTLDAAQVQWFAQKADPDAEFDAEPLDLGSLALRAFGAKWRTGPTDPDEVSTSAKIRLLSDRSYAPGSLTPQVLQRIRALNPLPRPVWYEA